MMIRWILYVALVVFMAYESVIYNNAVVTMLFVAAVIIVIFSLILLAIACNKLKIAVKIPVPVAEKNDRIQMQLHIDRGLSLPVGQIDVQIRFISGFTNQQKMDQLSVDHNGTVNSKIIYDIDSYHCGKVKVVIDRVRIKDIFGIFSLSKKTNISKEITFLPKIYETMVEVSEGVRHFAGETEEDEPEMAGNDHSQIYQIRPYRPGDRLQIIHWKLTARSGELFVREAGEPVCLAVGIFMDLYVASEEEKDNAEALIEAALSISNALLEQHCRHFICWYDPVAKKLCKQRVGKIEDIYELMSYLMSASCYSTFADLLQMYKEAFPYGLYAADITLRLSGDVLTAGEKVGFFDPDLTEKSMAKCLIRI